MKKVLLISALSISTLSYAQKQKVSEASRAISSYSSATSDGDKLKYITQAVSAINEAAKDEKTKEEAKTWFLKARIYTASLAEENYASEEQLIEANKSMFKALNMDQKLLNDKDYPVSAINLALNNFNTAIGEYNKQNFMVAKDYFGNIPKLIGDKPNPKYTNLYSRIDTIRAQAQYYQAKAEVFEENYTKGLELLEISAQSPHLNQLDVLADMIMALEKSGNKDKQLEYINKARQKYPNDPNIEAFEINYYIDTKQYDELVVRLENAIKNDPKNPKHPFNLGVVYSAKAAPVDGFLPEGHAKLEKKAEDYYKMALDLAGDNPDYNFNLGIHYFNLGVDAGNKAKNLMNGTEAEKARAGQQTEVRKLQYRKAMPILEKTAALYEDKKKMSNDDKNNYYNTLDALKKVYATLNETTKYTSNEKKIKEFLNANPR